MLSDMLRNHIRQYSDIDFATCKNSNPTQSGTESDISGARNLERRRKCNARVVLNAAIPLGQAESKDLAHGRSTRSHFSKAPAIRESRLFRLSG